MWVEYGKRESGAEEGRWGKEEAQTSPSIEPENDSEVRYWTLTLAIRLVLDKCARVEGRK